MCETETGSFESLMAARFPNYARWEVTEDSAAGLNPSCGGDPNKASGSVGTAPGVLPCGVARYAGTAGSDTSQAGSVLPFFQAT